MPEGRRLVSRRRAPDPRFTGLDIHQLTLETGSPRALHEVDLRVAPGELVCVIGPSGCGKSTLLEILAGLLPYTNGSGVVAGAALDSSMAQRSGHIGYVPQVESLNGDLSAREHIRYSLELRRLDLSGEEQSLRVGALLAELGLSEHADRPLRTLSGGQRKRVSVGIELVGDAEVLLLDEPTTGLDPGHERAILDLLSTTARSGRAVLVATHSEHLARASSKVLVLSATGHALYFGATRTMLASIGAVSFADLYEMLERGPGANRTPLSELGYVQAPRNGDRSRFAVLLDRQWAALWADRRSAWLFLLQAPLLGLMIRTMVGTDGLGLGAVAVNLTARRVLLTLVLCSVWLGSINGVREIVRERDTFRREQLIGVDPLRYLGAKLTFLSGKCLWHAAALTLCSVGFGVSVGQGRLVPFGQFEIGLDLWLAAISSGCVALLISALVRTTARALVVLPLVLLPQLILSGGVMSLADMGPLQPLSYLSVARWSLAQTASTTDLRGLETRTQINVPLGPADSRVARHEDSDWTWGPTEEPWLFDACVLLGMSASSGALTLQVLRHRGTATRRPLLSLVK